MGSFPDKGRTPGQPDNPGNYQACPMRAEASLRHLLVSGGWHINGSFQ